MSNQAVFKILVTDQLAEVKDDNTPHATIKAARQALAKLASEADVPYDPDSDTISDGAGWSASIFTCSSGD